VVRLGLGASTNPFLGGLPKGEVTPQPLPLSLKDAVQRALQNNLGLLLQEQASETARGAHWRALAELLPNLSAGLAEHRQIINLQAYGFPANPPLVGPFNVFDARVYLSQPVVDLAALNDARASGLAEKAAQLGVKDARDLVVLVAVNLYLEAVAAASRVDATHAQQATAEALLRQAQDLKAGGLVAGIDVLRAQTQVETQRQRTIAAESESEQAKLQLARAIGLPLAQLFTLTDTIPYEPVAMPTLDEALKRAMDTRPDYLAARSRFEAAQAARAAANAALLPTLRVDADYGAIGQTVSGALRTYTLAANVRIPIFDAGRTVARKIQAQAELQQREAELADFGNRVEYDVRTAFLNLRTAEQQLQAAKSASDLAGQQLQQARDRFAAGVASNLEVTQAQETVASASENYIQALYAFNLGRAALARAMGVAESAVMSYLGGRQ
jgi:outer membrane protein TolC